jgi:hypothetical protein
MTKRIFRSIEAAASVWKNGSYHTTKNPDHERPPRKTMHRRLAQWEDDGVVHQLAYGDLITVIRKSVSLTAISG